MPSGITLTDVVPSPLSPALNMLKYAEGSQLYKIHKIINIDYWGYVVDINLESFFENKLSS